MRKAEHAELVRDQNEWSCLETGESYLLGLRERREIAGVDRIVFKASPADSETLSGMQREIKALKNILEGTKKEIESVH